MRFNLGGIFLGILLKQPAKNGICIISLTDFENSESCSMNKLFMSKKDITFDQDITLFGETYDEKRPIFMYQILISLKSWAMGHMVGL